MIRFLLDTNVLSEPLRPRPDESLLEKLQTHQDHAAIPAPVWHELMFGCSRLAPSQRRDAIEAYLLEAVAPSFPILPYDGPAAAWHARERARLESIGLPPPYVDGQIAAVAGARGLTLVTANRKDFQRFQGLDIVSWRSESP